MEAANHPEGMHEGGRAALPPPVTSAAVFQFGFPAFQLQKKMGTATLETGWHTAAPAAAPSLGPPASRGIPCS